MECTRTALSSLTSHNSFDIDNLVADVVESNCNILWGKGGWGCTHTVPDRDSTVSCIPQETIAIVSLHIPWVGANFTQRR